MPERSSFPLTQFLWLLAVLAALWIGVSLLWGSDTRRGAQGAEYSVTRTDIRGSAIAYRLYETAGLKPRVWDRPLTRLREPGLLLLIAPARPTFWAMADFQTGTEGDILPDEIRALDDWVKQGNVAVLLSREYNDLYHALGLIVDEPKSSASSKAAEPVQPGVLADGVSDLRTQTEFGYKFGRKRPKQGLLQAQETVDEPAPIPEVPEREWLPLFTKKDSGREVAQVLSAARGKGMYVVVNDVFPAGNLGITTGDNARFMLNLARLAPGGGGIWFDEFHKRNVDRGLVAYLRERSLGSVLIYGFLLLLLLFWRTGVRFGEPEPLVADSRRDSAEYLRAVASLYRNAGMAREALGTIYADFQRRLTGTLRMDGLADLEEVGRRYEKRTGRPAREARQILIETEAALARPRLDDAEALQFCARLTQLDHVLTATKRTEHG